MLSKVIAGYSKHIHSFYADADADGTMSNYDSTCSCSTDTTGSLGNPEHFSSNEEHVNPDQDQKLFQTVKKIIFPEDYWLHWP